MDDEVLHAQCGAIGQCVKGVGLHLKTIGAGDGGCPNCVRVLSDFLELVKSAKHLGTYYSSEMRKKCEELSTKCKEVGFMSRKLQQLKGNGSFGQLTIQSPDFSDDDGAQRPKASDSEADHSKCKEELCKLREIETSVLQRLEKESERLEKSHNDVACLQKELDDSRKKAEDLHMQVRQVITSNESLSKRLLNDQKQLEELQRSQSNLKCCLHLIASKQAFTRGEYEQELSQMECWGFDEEIKAFLKTILGRSILPARKPVGTQTLPLHVSVATQTHCESRTAPGDSRNTPIQIDDTPVQIDEPDVMQDDRYFKEQKSEAVNKLIPACNKETVALWPGSDRLGSSKKRSNEFLFLDSKSEASRNSNLTLPSKIRKLDHSPGISSHRSDETREDSKSGQRRLAHGPSKVETVVLDDCSGNPVPASNSNSVCGISVESRAGDGSCRQPTLGTIGCWLEAALGVSVSVMEDAVRGSLCGNKKIWAGVMARTIDGVLEVSAYTDSRVTPKDWRPCIRYCFAVCCRRARTFIQNEPVIVDLSETEESKDRRVKFFREIVFAHTLRLAKSFALIGLQQEGLSGLRLGEIGQLEI